MTTGYEQETRTQMSAFIPGIQGSATHRTSTELLMRHRDAGNGMCDGCGHRAPCPARCHASTVIVAAGEDPRTYDAAAPDLASETRSVHAGHQPEHQDPPGTSAHTGYHLTGRSRRPESSGLTYERDDL
jgi:hypothetical protein